MKRDNFNNAFESVAIDVLEKLRVENTVAESEKAHYEDVAARADVLLSKINSLRHSKSEELSSLVDELKVVAMESDTAGKAVRDAYKASAARVNKNMERLYRLVELMFTLCGANEDPDRQSFVRQIRGMKYDWSTAEMIRILAKHGKEALALFGSPTPDVVDFAKLATASTFGVLPDADYCGKNLLAAVCANWHLASRWAQSGLNQFQISSGLGAGMILTDVSEKTDEDPLQLPFSAFVISLPDGIIPFFVPDADGSKQQWVDTIWIYEVVAGIDHLVCEPSEDSSDDFIPEDRIVLNSAWRFLRNFLRWLDAVGGKRALHPETIPRKLAEKRAKGKETWPVQWLIGKEVVLSPELRRAAADSALGKSRRHRVDGWKVRARFIVRGHWRNQAHGEGRKLRVRKWIQPFWKGPAGAVAWSHLYTDKG